MSKTFEKCMFCQMSDYMDNFLSKFSSRKGYNTQYCFLKVLKKWKLAVEKRKLSGALLTDLSKAFDCLFHDILLAKLHADGFSLSALKSIHSYLKN